MKLGPVTTIEKKNKTMPKKFDNDVMLASCDFIVIFLFMASLEQYGSGIPNV